MKNGTQVVECEVKKLIHASWNYKTDGTPEQIKALSKAIDRRKSCGVLAVREVVIDGQELFEVMDGNHRLTAIREELNWDKVPIENFGVLSQAEAIILTRQRNEQWFDDDKLKLANLFTEFVYPEVSKEELQEILPESLEQLNFYQEMSDMDWTAPEQKEPDTSSGDGSEKLKTIHLNVYEDVYNIWLKWLDRVEDTTGIDNEMRAFEFAIIEALNVPDEDLISSYEATKDDNEN